MSPSISAADALGIAIGSEERNARSTTRRLIAENASSQLRVIRPIAANLTEMQTWCIAPRGESAQARALRIRQYEDFFNVSGMGTADDLEEFRACQAGYAGIAAQWNDMSRGAPLWIDGPDENAKKMGMNPLLSGERSEDEGLFVRQHEYWAHAMRDALAAERKEVTA